MSHEHDDDDPFASPARSNAKPAAPSSASASSAAPISPRLLPPPPPPMPPAPQPLRMEGYLRKLKSDESKLGAMFSRSKFNKRWFAIEEKGGAGLGADESTEAMLAQFGPLYELKYWKASTDVGLKLPSFSLDLSAIRGVGEGVGRGPFTREAHAFHVETLERTYVLTASKREEMLWWITGLQFYCWQHNETVRRIESAEHEAAETARTGRSAADAGVIMSPGRDAFAAAAAGAGAPAPSARRRSLPGQVGVADLGSPVSSSEGSSVGGAGSPSPLPAFSPLAAQDPLASPVPLGSDNRLRVELRPFGAMHDAGGLQSLRLSGTFGAGAADRSAREAAAAAQLDDDEIEEELEHKYDDDAAAETNDTSARAYPSMHDDHNHSASDDPFAALHNEASAPPQTDRAGVPVRSALVASPFEAALSPRIADASAPPQTNRPAAASPPSLPAKVAAISSPAATNPHARSPVAAASAVPSHDDDDDDPFAAHHADDASSPPSLGHTAGEESFHVVMSNVSPSHAAVAAAVAEVAAAPSARETNAGETNRSEDPFSTHVADAGAAPSAAAKPALQPPPRTPDDEEQEDLVRSELARPGGRSSRRSGGGGIGEASADDHDHDHTPNAAEEASSLGPEDESIMNGSMMLAESHMHIEGEAKSPFKPPPGVPSINPAAGAAKRSSVVQLPPITQQPSQPASSPAASATPLALKAEIASASVAPAPASAARSGFTPSNSTDCNTEAQFARLRQELRAYGVDRLIADQVATGWFVTDAATGEVRVSDAPKPFNPFARLVTGALVAPYPNQLQRWGMHEADRRFFVAQNRPELAAQWASSDPAWIGRASMAQHHEFLLLRDLQWNTFNVSTFGLLQSGGGGGAGSCTASSLRAALALLDDIESTGVAYAKAAGWSRSLGIFFHAFPFNSVQALHAHMLDLETTGPTFEHLNHKNLSLDAVRNVIRRELDDLAAASGEFTSATLATTLGASQPGQSSSTAAAAASELPADAVQVSLRLDADFSATASPSWRDSFVAEMARALSISPARLRVLSLRAGSILVDLAVLPGFGVADASAAQVVAKMQRQSADAKSALRQGSITGAIREVKVTKGVADSVAASSAAAAAATSASAVAAPVSPAKSLIGSGLASGCDQIQNQHDPSNSLSLPTLLRAKTFIASDATDTQRSSSGAATGAQRYTQEFVPKDKLQPAAMQVRIWVSAPLRDLTREGSWLSAFLVELSSALRISPHRLSIVCVDPESQDDDSRLIVTLTILPKQAEHELEPHEIAEAIRAQVSDAQSPLRRGRIGAKTTKVRVVSSAEEQHMHHPAELHDSRTPSVKPIAPSPVPAAAIAPGSALAVNSQASSSKHLASALTPNGASHGHRGSVSFAGDSPSAPPASAGNWKNDLSSLLQSDKLPYEDVPTHRLQQSQQVPHQTHAHHQSVAPIAASRAHSHSASHASCRSTSIAAPVTAGPPIATCDQCFSAITSATIFAATYNWSSHLVLCGRCQAATTHHQRVAAPLREPLASFLAHQAEAYCAHHSLPAPALPSPFVSSPGAAPVRLGVRARALRFTGLLSCYCDGCALLLCDQCRAEDGVHHHGTAHAVQTLTAQHSKHAGKLAGVIKSQLLPKRAEMMRQLQSLQTLRERTAADEAAVHAETLRAREESLSAIRLRSERVKHDAAMLEDALTEQLRQLDLADEMMQQQQSRQTPASMCALLAQSPSIIEQSRAIFASPIGSAAAGSFTADGYAAAPAASAGVAELLQSLRREQEAIVSERKDNEDKIQALPSLESAIATKDRDLQSILSSRRGLVASSAAQAQSLNSLYSRAHAEINEWMAMTEGMATKIAQMKQTCAHCGVALSAAAANTRCSAARAARGNATLGLHAFVPNVQMALE